MLTCTEVLVTRVAKICRTWSFHFVLKSGKAIIVFNTLATHRPVQAGAANQGEFFYAYKCAPTINQPFP